MAGAGHRGAADAGDENARYLGVEIPFVTGPGVYKITDLESGKCYYGETANLPWRIGVHITQLSNGSHITKALQEDWNTKGASNFSFTIYAYGPPCDTKEKRLAIESSLVEAVYPFCYNCPNADYRPRTA
jgi:group I intron endonuclease